MTRRVGRSYTYHAGTTGNSLVCPVVIFHAKQENCFFSTSMRNWHWGLSALINNPRILCNIPVFSNISLWLAGGGGRQPQGERRWDTTLGYMCESWTCKPQTPLIWNNKTLCSGAPLWFQGWYINNRKKDKSGAIHTIKMNFMWKW